MQNYTNNEKFSKKDKSKLQVKVFQKDFDTYKSLMLSFVIIFVDIE